MISLAKSFTLVTFLCWSSLVTLGVSDSPVELCAVAGAYFCEFANVCLSTRFAPTTLEKALVKCKSLSDERVKYGVIFYDSYAPEIDETEEPLMNCMEIALPASGIMANEKFWDIGNSDLPASCKAYEYEREGDEIHYHHNLESVGCYDDHAFSCAGRIQKL